MLYKLSVKNIKKSIKDYSIYFFTLVFAIALFYMFNSLDAQNSMLSLNDSKYEIIRVLIQIINYISVFVSIILGFLIIYSNNFLIKRRKKEIGLYYILGMDKKKVSIILVLETILIGIVSLFVGIILGIFLSQFSSLLIAKLFEVDMTAFKFIFSVSALRKTLLYFGITFILVIIFNVITLSRHKLIDLLHASKKNEKIKIRNKWLTLITFILALVFIGIGYYELFHDGLVYLNNKTAIMLASGAFGTFLLFYSLAGFLLTLIQKNKKLYYKNLNMFILKQVNNKINTTVFSTTIISLMLLLTITILSGCLSFAKAFNSDLASNNLTDFTYIEYINDNKSSIQKASETGGIDNYASRSIVLTKYESDLKNEELMDSESIKSVIKDYGMLPYLKSNSLVITYSDYKALMELTNRKVLPMGDDEYIFMCNIETLVDYYKTNYESDKSIVINGVSLKPATKKIVKEAVENYTSAGNEGLIVVSDNLVKDFDLSTVDLIGFYNNEDKNTRESLENLIMQGGAGYNIRYKDEMIANSLGIKVMATFVGLYLGIIFAISSATVLAIGQLSESSDNKQRFSMIRRLGADEKEINKALMIQIGISFAFPLVVALIHSAVALNKFNSLIKALGNIDISSSIFATAIFMLVVYGGYYLVTYLCSKYIIKE